jgi:hypothetical protein
MAALSMLRTDSLVLCNITFFVFSHGVTMIAELIELENSKEIKTLNMHCDLRASVRKIQGLGGLL